MSRQGKRRPRTIENVKDFWNSEADDWGDDPRVTIRDHHFRLLTISRISELVKGRRYLLDIGCGSGFSTLFYAQVVDRLVGVDYAEVMVKKAQRFLQDPIYFEEVMSRYEADG